jgi:hypothetical protein
MRNFVGVALALLITGGCNQNLPSASFIDKLRVLAVRAEPPALPPGGTTTLSLLVAGPWVPNSDGSPPASTRALWFACPPLTATSTCGIGGIGGISSEAPAPSLIGSGGSLSYTLPANATGEQLIGVAVTDDTTDPPSCLKDLQDNGHITQPDHCVLAIKRVTVDSGAKPNHNPTLTALEFEEAPKQPFMDLVSGKATFALNPSHGARSLTLRATRSSEPAERKPDGNYEQLSVAWYSTAGSIDGNVGNFNPAGCSTPGQCGAAEPMNTSLTDWYPPTASEAAPTLIDGNAYFWAVIRDDRGGVGWILGHAAAR